MKRERESIASEEEREYEGIGEESS